MIAMTAMERNETGKQIINVGLDIARALCGDYTYVVELHAMPRVIFHCDANTADDAHKMALSVAQKEGKARKVTGATIQRKG